MRATLELCSDSNPYQQFQYQNASFYPYETVSLGSFDLATKDGYTAPGSEVVFVQTTGMRVAICDPTSIAQQLTYTGSDTTPGQLKTPQNLCVSGDCLTPDIGCAPLLFVDCDVSKKIQQFLFVPSNGSIIADNGLCVSTWGEVRVSFA